MTPTLLVVHPGAVGDVLLARPVLQRLRVAHPSCALGLLARQDIGAVLLAGGEIDALFPLEGNALSGLLAGLEAVPPALKQWLAGCRLAVCWMRDPGDLEVTLRACGVARVIIEPSSPGSGTVHQSDYLQQTLAGVVAEHIAEATLVLPDAVKERARAVLGRLGLSRKPFVVIHPGSGSPHKCVAPDILASVVDRIQKRIRVALIAGPADSVQMRDVLDRCLTKPVVLEGYGLLTTAGLLAEAALVIGHDSGLTHLAAALGTRTVALFGPTSVERWAPRGTHVTVVTGPACRCLGWEAVRQCQEKHCLAIQPDQILAACGAILFGSGETDQQTDPSESPLPCSPL